MIKLLIVDDSALMRRQLMTLFQAEGDFEIRQARNGDEAVRENREFQPDVVTLDINMPEMDGLTALSLIMAERPVAVVMVSSLTNEGALATFEALNLGAVDYIAKPGGTISLSIDRITEELVAKVRAAARARPRGKGSTPAAAGSAHPGGAQEGCQAHLPLRRAVQGASDGLLVIGASTGGPRALEIVLSGLPADFPWPVLVAQHMPAAFTRAFAERLNQCCALQVVEAGSAPAGRGRQDLHRQGRRGHAAGQPRRQADNYAGAGESPVPVASVGRIAGPIGVGALRSQAGDGGVADRHGLRRIGRVH